MQLLNTKNCDLFHVLTSQHQQSRAVFIYRRYRKEKELINRAICKKVLTILITYKNVRGAKMTAYIFNFVVPCFFFLMFIPSSSCQAIWPYSGHYCPTEENFVEFISFLKEHRVNLTHVKVISSIMKFSIAWFD